MQPAEASQVDAIDIDYPKSLIPNTSGRCLSAKVGGATAVFSFPALFLQRGRLPAGTGTCKMQGGVV